MTAPIREQVPLPQLSACDYGDVTVVSLRGELDFVDVPALSAYLSDIRWRGRPRCVVDVTGPLSTERIQPYTRPRKEESAVSILKKIRHKAQTAKGKTKKNTGRVTGNRRLKAEGRTGQVAGEAKQATDKVKGAFKH